MVFAHVHHLLKQKAEKDSMRLQNFSNTHNKIRYFFTFIKKVYVKVMQTFKHVDPGILFNPGQIEKHLSDVVQIISYLQLIYTKF